LQTPPSNAADFHFRVPSTISWYGSWAKDDLSVTSSKQDSLF